MPRRSITKEANDVVEDILALTERPTRSSKRKLEEILQEQVVEIAPEDAQTPKRGRGRPKASKIENEINSTEDKLLEDEELEEIEERKPAQKRGRKKKELILTSKPEAGQISSSIIEPEVSEIESASPKRIRRKQRTLESDDDSDIVPPPVVAVDQSVASPSKITVQSMPVVVASSSSNSIHSVGNRGTGTIDTKATLPSHHSITDIAALRPPVSSDSQSISVARSVSDSNLIGSSGNVGKIAKKKREIDLNSMTAEEIEDAMMPSTSEWTAELEDKMECCQSLREGKFTQHHTIETVLDEISPEATKLHGLIKKARSTPALLAAHQETVSMGLSMNGGTFLNTINTNFRKECLSKNQSPYGEACDENGVEISNLHLAWMNAAVLEDVLIQRAAATQEVLQRMKEQQLRPSIAEACHWWGLRDAEVVEKELVIKLREDARKKQEEMVKEKEEKLTKERAMLPPPPPPPAPGTNLRPPPPRPIIPPPVAPAPVPRALPVAPTVAHIPANAPKPTGHLQSHAQQQQLLPPPKPILVPALPSHLGYGAAVLNAPKAPTSSSPSLPSGQSGYGHATNNFASSVPEVKQAALSSSSLNLKADQGSVTNGGKAHYKSSLTSSSHTKSTKSRHDHSHRSRSRSVSKNRESKRQKSKEFHSKRYREDERSRSRSSSSRHHQSHRRGRSRSRSVSPPKDDRKHDSRKEKHRDRDNSLEDHRRSKAESNDRKDRNSKGGFSNQHGSSSANKDNHRYRAQDKHEGTSSFSSHPHGSYDSGSGHHKNPISSSATGNSHHHSQNNNSSHSNHASSTFPVAKIPPPPARPHPTHYSSSHHSNYDDHSHQRQHNSQNQHNQSYRGSHASSASSNSNSGRSHHSSSYKDHTSRR